MSNNIVILGSEGFIGNSLVKWLSPAYSITGVDIVPLPSSKYNYIQNNTSTNFLSDLLRQQNYQCIINAAGSGNVGYSLTNPDFDFEKNVLNTQILLEAIRREQPQCQYIHLSSAAVYGNPIGLPIAENAALKPMSPYGWHKVAAELLCEEYATVFGLNTLMVRPFSVYGPGLRKQLFWDLFQKYAANNNTVEVWGTGNETRDFVYIDDLCHCIELLLQKGDFFAGKYNIASGIETSIKKAAELFLQQYNPIINVLFNNKTKPGDPLNWRADIDKLKQLGYQPQHSFEEGIKKAASWIKSQN